MIGEGAAAGPWLATLYLALFGSALTFSLYFWLLARRSAVAASLISYTVPICAVLVGWLVFDEPVTWRLARRRWSGSAGGGRDALDGQGPDRARRGGGPGRAAARQGCRLAVKSSRTAASSRAASRQPARRRR